METVYVVDALRTAVGRYGGALSTIRPDDLLANVIAVSYTHLTLPTNREV